MIKEPSARVGMVSPLLATDEVPYQFYRLQKRLDDWTVSITEASVDLAAFTVKAADDADGKLEHAVNALVRKQVQLVIVAGIPIVALKGVRFWRERLNALSETHGIPFTTTFDCVMGALHALGAQKIAIANKWTDGLNRRLVAEVQEFGRIEVVGVSNQPHSALQVSSLAPQEGLAICRDLCRQALQQATQRPDAVMLAGGAWYSLLTVPELETELGIPIITNPGAAFWWALHQLGRLQPIDDWGRLYTLVPPQANPSQS